MVAEELEVSFLDSARKAAHWPTRTIGCKKMPEDHFMRNTLSLQVNMFWLKRSVSITRRNIAIRTFSTSQQSKASKWSKTKPNSSNISFRHCDECKAVQLHKCWSERLPHPQRVDWFILRYDSSQFKYKFLLRCASFPSLSKDCRNN